jgi:hypothetical protein
MQETGLESSTRRTLTRDIPCSGPKGDVVNAASPFLKGEVCAVGMRRDIHEWLV